jgi:uncharacterized protein YbjT (DUF2867 family)
MHYHQRSIMRIVNEERPEQRACHFGRIRGERDKHRSQRMTTLAMRVSPEESVAVRRVLVTGATGKIGSELVRRLAGRDGITVRAFVRNPEGAVPLLASGASVACGRFEDTRAVRAAVAGVDTIALITPAGPDAADQAAAVLDAAKRAGVRKIVRISVFKADVNGPTAVTQLHGRTDCEILRSGLTYTILRPPFFMQNLLFLAARTIATKGKICFGSGDGRLGMIDRRDVIECAEECVVSDTHDDQVLTLTGPESIGFGQIAERLTAVLRRPVRYVPVSPEAVEQSVCAMGGREWYAKVMRDLCQAYSRNWGDVTTDGVARITRRAPRAFDAFAREVLVPALVVAAGGWR